MLGIQTVIAGGIPVLFPFSGKTADDAYFIGSKKYSMPMHGLVKDATFSVERMEQSNCVLSFDPNRAIKRENYPYDFILLLDYTVKHNELIAKAIVKNNSDQPMPHYLGWHPYFKATDKKSLDFQFSMKEYYDYTKDGVKGVLKEKIDFSMNYDHVFMDLNPAKMVLKNPVDGYQAEIITDRFHNIVTICTKFDRCVCIEPWLAPPNAINTGEFLKFVNMKNQCEYWTKITFNLL